MITLGTERPKLLPRAGTNADLRLPLPALMIIILSSALTVRLKYPWRGY